MKAPDRRTAKLLDQTVDLMFRIYVIRGACSETANAILKKNLRDHQAIEDCARLDDALAQTYRSLQATVRFVQRSRARKRRRTTE